MSKVLAWLKSRLWRLRVIGKRLPASFDANWYVARYPDVFCTEMDPALHYLRFGMTEGREPGAAVEGLGARPCTPLGYALAGRRARHDARPVVMLCGHRAGEALFGAERSLLDVARALAGLDVNVVVVLPSAVNRDYLDAFKPWATNVLILPYGWVDSRRRPTPAVVETFRNQILELSVDIVYVNTLTLYEPLVAAQQVGVARWIHVREVPGSDVGLARLLGAGADWQREHVYVNSDVLLANSAFTASRFPARKALVVPNIVDVESFRAVTSPVETGGPLTFGLVSSNLANKGLRHFSALARMLQSAAPEVRLRLIGPDTEYSRAIAAESLPNVELVGYQASPQAAMAQLDVLLSLSEVEESFGRTVLEAMACARPVIAFDRGAVSELVTGDTGLLVPAGDIDALLHAVIRLRDDSQYRARLGRGGLARARSHFEFSAMQQSLARALAMWSEERT